MRESDDHAEAMLTAEGAPFALTDIVLGGVAMRGFRRAEACLGDLLAALDTHGDQPFIVDGDRRLSFADVASASGRIGATLVAHGIRPGDRVGIAMRNGAEWIASFLAAVGVGAVPALVNSRGSEREMRTAIALVDARLVLCDDRRAAMLGDTAACHTPVLDCARGGPPLPRFAAAPGDAAMILFTSGTTGQAKGVVLSHRATLTGLLLTQLASASIAIRLYGAAAIAAPRAQQASLLAYPLFHVSGCHATFLAALAAGNRLVLATRWDADAVVDLIRREGVTAVSGSPAMIWDLIAAKSRAGVDLPTLTSVSTGGQAQPVNLLAAVVAAFAHAIVGTGFGATETAGAIAMHVGDDYLAQPRAAGRVLPLAEVRIRDATGTTLPPGAAGEIVVRGPMLMSGYWNDPAATARAMGDGWFRTGDIGMLDAAGNLTILDRLTDMVICGGENIYCAEVEAALQQQDDIVEAAAFGVPDDRLGERLAAVIRPRADAVLDPAAVGARVAGLIADYKIPRLIFITTAGLPRNALGKVDKRALRAAHANARNHDAAA